MGDQTRNFVLKEECDPEILRQCLVTGKTFLDGPSKNSFRKYANLHLNSKINTDGYSSVYVHYTTKIFEGNSIGRMYPIIGKDEKNYETHKDRRCMTFSNNMPKILRDTLCADVYHDIDFKNSHPNLLLQLFKQHDIKCKQLKIYVKNRDTIIEEICEFYNIEKDIAKLVFIQMLYGGSYKQWKKDNCIDYLDDYSFIIEFQENVRRSVIDLLDLQEYSRYTRYVKYINKNNPNPFSTVSYLLMTIENRCLVQLYYHFISLNYTIGSFEYDGMKIKRKGSGDFPTEHLISGQDFIKQTTGFKIELVEKPLEKSIELNYDIVTIDDDTDAAYRILKDCKGIIVYCKENKAIYYKKDNIWNRLKSQKELNCFIRNYSFVLRGSTDGKFYNKFTRNVEYISRAIVDEISKYPENCVDNFENLIYRSTIGKLCYKNGIYNFASHEFIPWSDPRSNNIYTTVIINNDYNENIENLNQEKEYIYSLLSEQFGENVFKDVLKVISRALAGHSEDKRWVTLFGHRDSGKGLFCHLLQSTFGINYIGSTNSSNFSRKNGSSDSNKDKGWIIPLRHSRLVITNEIDTSMILNGALIKEICSGGDYITARSLYSESISFKHQFTFMICCNDIPKTEPLDANKTRVVIDMPYSYVSQEEMDKYTDDQRSMLRLADTDIKTKLSENKKYLDAFTQLIFESYENTKPSIPILDECGETFIDNPTDLKKEIMKFFIVDKSDSSLFIPNSHLKTIFKEIRANLSITDSDSKLKKILKDQGAIDHQTHGVRGLKFIKLKEIE